MEKSARKVLGLAQEAHISVTFLEGWQASNFGRKPIWSAKEAFSAIESFNALWVGVATCWFLTILFVGIYAAKKFPGTWDGAWLVTVVTGAVVIGALLNHVFHFLSYQPTLNEEVCGKFFSDFTKFHTLLPSDPCLTSRMNVDEMNSKVCSSLVSRAQIVLSHEATEKELRSGSNTAQNELDAQMQRTERARVAFREAYDFFASFGFVGKDHGFFYNEAAKQSKAEQ